jgi:hypothetical protein
MESLVTKAATQGSNQLASGASFFFNLVQKLQDLLQGTVAPD